MRVGIVARRGSDRAVGLASDVAAALAAASASVVVDETTHEAMTAGDGATRTGDGSTTTGDEETDLPADAPAGGSIPPGIPVSALADCDLAVSIGGDGTFLFAARNADGTPLLGVNLGEVGFLTAVEPEAAVETVCAVVEEIRERGAPQTRHAPRLVAEGPDWTLPPAVNEVVLAGSRRGHGGGIDVTVDVDGERYTEGHADGVLVATPVGSTAYNVSEGGPLVHLGVDGLVVTVMAGDGTMPPLVVPAAATITLRAAGASDAVAAVDGRIRQPVQPPATIEVGLADEPLAIAAPSLEYFDALAKLD